MTPDAHQRSFVEPVLYLSQSGPEQVMDSSIESIRDREPGKGTTVSVTRRVLANAIPSKLLIKGNAYAIPATNHES